MNIGSLYKVKKWSWLLCWTKETVEPLAVHDAACTTVGAEAAAYYNKSYNCEVTYFSLDSYIVFLEEDGKLKKVLTSDGLVGWTWFNEIYNDCFEEVKAKS